MQHPDPLLFTPADIEHNPAAQHFRISRAGESALLEYHLLERHGQQVVDFYHTFVPNAWRGRQVAALLTDAALQWAQAEQLQIIASCSYVASRLRS